MNLLNHCKRYMCEGTTLEILTTNGDGLPVPHYIPLHKLTGSDEFKERATLQAVMFGDGVDKPSGVLNCPTIGRIDGPVTCDKAIDAIYKVPAEFRRNGVFVAGLPQKPGQDVRTLRDADGRLAWEAAPIAGQSGKLFGYPLLHVEGLDGLLFGSFADGYALGLRPDRVGGDVIEPDAFCMVTG